MTETPLLALATFAVGLALVACKDDAPARTGDPPVEAGTSSASSGSTGSSGSVAGKRVFVSSASFDGDLGGVAGGDARCQRLAEDAALDGTWRAWLSTPASSVDARFAKSTLPYVRLDGVKVASSYADLIATKKLLAPISVDETMAVLPQTPNRVFVWTNTSAAGASADASSNCNAWTTADNTTGVVGNALEDGSGWTIQSSNVPACVTPLRLYCFEQ